MLNGYLKPLSRVWGSQVPQFATATPWNGGQLHSEHHLPATVLDQGHSGQGNAGLAPQSFLMTGAWASSPRTLL